VHAQPWKKLVSFEPEWMEIEQEVEKELIGVGQRSSRQA